MGALPFPSFAYHSTTTALLLASPFLSKKTSRLCSCLRLTVESLHSAYRFLISSPRYIGILAHLRQELAEIPHKNFKSSSILSTRLSSTYDAVMDSSLHRLFRDLSSIFTHSICLFPFGNALVCCKLDCHLSIFLLCSFMSLRWLQQQLRIA